MRIALKELTARQAAPPADRMSGLSVVVVRAFPAGVFQIDYTSPTRMPRVHARGLLERLQDEFDAAGAPLRAYLYRDGIPIEAAHCLRSHRS